MRNAILVLSLAVLVLPLGCEEHFTNAGDASAGDGVGDGSEQLDLFRGDGIGAACAKTDSCRSGLACKGGKCAAGGAKKANDACILSADCEKSLQCGFFGFCVASAGKANGASCTSVSDCQKGSYCDLKGIAGFCTAAAKAPKDLYGTCKSTGDCWPGLHCNQNKQCMPGSVTLSPDLFPGAACPVRQEEKLPFQARNRIPRGDEATHGFYSTPFPSNLRLTPAGKVDLSAHPRPGNGLIGLDLVGNVIDAIGKELSGFSVAPTVLFRWTRPLDPKSLKPSGPSQNIFFVDLTPGLKQPHVQFTHQFNPDRNKYICGNWLAIHPTWKSALKAKTMYAVYITDTVSNQLPEEGGDSLVPVQGDDLKLLLSTKAPTKSIEKAAWDRFGQLRKYMASKQVPVARVVAATVFTTDNPVRIMRQFRNVVLKAPPIVGKMFHCGVTKGTSPCATPNWAKTAPGKAGKADPRGCPANSGSNPFHELHFKLKLPVFQQGTRPYLSSGGAVKLAGGKVQSVGTENVCAVLTVPKKTRPSVGWPVLIYGHGTGGSFRSGATQMSAAVSNMKFNGLPANMALLGIDQPMHGDRRGLPLDPGPLFYNFANPPAAKGNFYQGAADNHSLVRFLRGYSASLPKLGKVNFNKGKIYFMGHSQGGTTGPMFAPYAHDDNGNRLIEGYVFSGAGAGLVFSLLNKKSPEDATIGIKLALQEVDLDAYHPVLSLFQFYYDEVDPLVYAPQYFHTLHSQPVHVLHTFGQNDTYTPPETSRVFTAALHGWMMRRPGVGKWFDIIGDLGVSVKDHNKPVKGNIEVPWKGKKYAITGVTVQHLNDAARSKSKQPYDGHFVAFRDQLCSKQVTTFLASGIAQTTPTVVAK
ncbi:MAG: hypothetical protein KC502_16020 [Myxococcales bacterium]|nr:hypothetical protein [Myxococcales bacterium]